MAGRFALGYRFMAAATLSGLIGLFIVLTPAQATQFNQGLQDGWAIGDSGQITGGQLLTDEFGFMQQAGAGWVRVNFRLGQCFTDWTTVGCNGMTALQTYDQVSPEPADRVSVVQAIKDGVCRTRVLVSDARFGSGS